jgi:hypothetical protein
MKKILLTLTLCSLGFAQIHAAIIYVSKTATGANNGTSWANAFTSLQDALNSAQDGDEIWVKNGIYFPERDLNGNSNPSNPREKCFYVGAANLNLTIRGGFNGTETNATEANPELYPTIIDGDIGTTGDNSDNNYSLVKINGGNIDFNGFTFQNAKGYIVNVYFPGAILINSTTATFARFFNCKFLNNQTSYRGAAIYAEHMNSVHIFDCYFYNNFSIEQGGALYLINKESLVQNSVFKGNSSGYGGAIKFSGGTSAEPHKVNYCTFINNTVTAAGGSIQAFSANVRITNSTFYNSTSSFGEFSIFNCNSFKVYNSIIWSPSITSPLHVGGGSNTYEVTNCIFHTTVSGTNISTNNPKFVNAPENLKLQSCSPARNAGDTTLIATEAPAPFPGVQESIVDLGANEYVKPEISSNGSTLSLNMAPSVYSAESFQWINCTTGDTIPGANNPNFTATQSGTYACVTVTADCPDTSNCVAITIVGLDDIKTEMFRIYPNPASNVINVEMENASSIRLFDIRGKLLKELNGASIYTIDVSDLTSGMYMIQSAEGQTVKFIKE